MSAAKQSDFTPAQRAHTRRTLLLLLAYAIILPPLVWLVELGYVLVARNRSLLSRWLPKEW